MKRIFILVIALTTCMCISIAQNPVWMNYTNGENISAIAENNYSVWIGTTAGLVKFDKTSEMLTYFTAANSPLPNNMISSIATDGSFIPGRSHFQKE
jgi:ligand-binding sensor domain-containing protein